LQGKKKKDGIRKKDMDKKYENGRWDISVGSRTIKGKKLIYKML
jgi:hypothetical protein